MITTTNTSKIRLKPQSTYIALPPSLVLLAAILLTYRSAIRSPGFAVDDAYHIFLATQLDWYRFLYVPEIYQRTSTAYLTPLSVAYYTLAQHIGAFSASTYLSLQTLIFGGWLLAIATFLRARFNFQQNQLLAFLLLSLSITTVGTLLSRFYSEHYIFGGIGSTLALLSLNHYQTTRRSHYFIATILLMAVSALSKEIFLCTFAISIFLYWNDKSIIKKLILIAPFLLSGYLIYRHYMLGTNIGGRGSHEDIWLQFTEVIHALPKFAYFYATSHASLLLLLLISLIVSPIHAIKGCLIALLLATPSLAAPHAFLEPELHSDRLFIACDLTLSATIAYCLFNKNQSHQSTTSKRNHLVFWVIVLVGLAWSIYQTAVHDRRTATSPDYKITNAILEAQAMPNAVYLPPNFANSSLIAAFSQSGNRQFEVTSNCLLALAWPQTNNMLFNSYGDKISRDILAKSCQADAAQRKPGGTVRFNNGILSWHIQGADTVAAGVYFPAHALLIEAHHFEERLVRPSPGEKYSIFTRDGTKWWFSEVQDVEFGPQEITSSHTTAPPYH
jgi:hypothetical protein